MHRVTRRILAIIACLLVSGMAHADGFRLLKLGGMQVKWGEPRAGSGAEVVYGFATAPVSFPDALNCRELAPVGRLGGGLRPEQVAKVAAGAFALWQQAANLAFRPARAGETPDILIGAQGRPDRIAFANVWPDRAGAVRGVAPIARATICLNPNLVWVADGAGAGQADLGTVLAHEIGHALGLDHPGPTGALMGYRDQGDIDRLMAGDVAGAVALYGRAKD